MSNSKRIEVLDAFRGIAALSVVLYHFTYRYSSLYEIPIPVKLPAILNYGYLGVHLFFIISGFVIYMTINKGLSIKFFYIKGLLVYIPHTGYV